MILKHFDVHNINRVEVHNLNSKDILKEISASTPKTPNIRPQRRLVFVPFPEPQHPVHFKKVSSPCVNYDDDDSNLL
jgi:hypothetical protein